MIYDLTTLALLPNTLGAVLPILPETYKSYAQTGTPLGCFSCDFGALNRFTLLTAYESTEALFADRARILTADDPYKIGKYLANVTSTAYEPFSFMGEIETGAFGPFYEIRTYAVAPGGMPSTVDAWSKVIERRQEMSKLLTVMQSIGSTPQTMVHIWPYSSIEERSKARAQASKEGIWPPAGSGTHLTAMQSELFVATAFSDLK